MFKHLIWLSAVVIAVCAALFSVTGIATLFAGSFITVAIMASAMELGKLVAASYLYRYWLLTPKALKAYLMTGVVVLMLITSLGIYAYLTAAYAKVAANPARILNEISFMDTRQQSLNSSIERYQRDMQSIDDRRIRVEGRLDSTLVGSTNLNQRSAWASSQAQLNDLDNQRKNLETQLESAVTERDSLESQKAQNRAELNQDSKIGTFVYVAEMLGIGLDDVVKYFTLIIVFVFDPLAVSLILAYNIIAMKERGFTGKAKNYKIYEEEDSLPEPEPVEASKEEKPKRSRKKKKKKSDDEVWRSPRISKLKTSNIPYFAHPDYDWDNDDRWKDDTQAKLYRERQLSSIPTPPSPTTEITDRPDRILRLQRERPVDK